MKKGSRHGIVPATYQRDIIKRFMSEKDFAVFVENYKASSYKKVTKPANDVDRRLVKTFKELGSVGAAARMAGVSSGRVYAALSRVVYAD